MAQIIRSGAFLQQCWSVHPLCVTVKGLSDDRTIILLCSSCRSAHRLSVAAVTAQGAAAQRESEQRTLGKPEDSLLDACLSAHHASVTISAMDVIEDQVQLRCAVCRRLYELTVSSFETRQR